MTPEEKRRLAQQPPAWMYAWDLGDGVVTPLLDPELASIHATRERMALGWIDRLYPEGLQGHACLDVACNEGYFSHLLWRRGAAVTGIDVRQLNVRRARVVQQLTGIDGARLRFEEADLYHFEAPPASFEICLFLGILYHVEDPMGALRRLHALTRGVAVVETQLTRQSEPLRGGWGQSGVTSRANAVRASFPTGPPYG
jgi:tRNA (mo5U34)-methyltransferase